MLIAFFSVFILKERLDTRKLAALLFGFLGVIVVLTEGRFQDVTIERPGIIGLVTAGAACFALYSVLSRKIKNDPIVSITIYFLSACIASFISMMIFSDFAVPSGNEILPVLLNGIFINGISYVFWLSALKSTETSYLAPFTFITPVLSALYLMVFFDESFLPTHAAGFVCILSGGLINKSAKSEGSNHLI